MNNIKTCFGPYNQTVSFFDSTLPVLNLQPLLVVGLQELGGTDPAATECVRAFALGVHTWSSCGKETMPFSPSPPGPERKIPHSHTHNEVIDSSFLELNAACPGSASALPSCLCYLIGTSSVALGGMWFFRWWACVAKRRLLEEQQSLTCWEWIRNRELK